MVSLFINLLLESERRSSSRISQQFIIKLAAAVLVLVLAFVVFFVLWRSNAARQERAFAEQERKQTEPVYRTVNAMRQELNDLQNITNSVGTWARTRPDWAALLLGIQKVVPETIQLTRMTASESVTVVDGVPMRALSIYLKGMAAGSSAETDVQNLEKSLREKPPFKDVMESAQVKQFEAGKTEKERKARLFDMECRLKPMNLFQPVKLVLPEIK